MKGKLFKGQKKKTIPLNKHGKIAYTRKGKRFIKSSKITEDIDANRELTKFINRCNEIKAASVASKDGNQLNILKTNVNPSNSSEK